MTTIEELNNDLNLAASTSNSLSPRRRPPYIDFTENEQLEMLRTDRDLMDGCDENGVVYEK